MTMKAANELIEEGRVLAQSIADGALGAPARVRTESSGRHWNPTLNRHIHEQHLSVWKPFSLLDLILDGAGRVIGFVDHEAYRRAEGATVLDDERTRGLVEDEELLPARSRIVGRIAYPGPEGGTIWGVTVEHEARGVRRRWMIEVNPARAIVAAVRPLDPA